MSRAALAFVAGLGGGYMKQSQYQDELARQAKLDQMAQESHDVQMRTAQRDEDLRVALSQAAAPANVTQSASLTGLSGGDQPAQYDDANLAQADIRQSKTMADATGTDAPPVSLSDAGYAAGPAGSGFGSQQAAQQAAGAYNSPDALSQRQQLAYAKAGQPDKAASLALTQAKSQEAQQQLADMHWQRKVGDAIAAPDWSNFETLINQSEAGPMQGKTVKIVPSDDGKTVTVNTVDDQGNMTPTGLQFSNDQAGRTQAGFALDKSVTPSDRFKLYSSQQMAAAQLARENARDKSLDEYHRGMVQNGAERAQGYLARMQALSDQLKSKGDGNLTHEERIRYTSLFSDAGRRMRDTQQTINTLQRDTLFTRAVAKNPTGPEATQLKQLQGDLDGYRQERTTYQGLLAQGTPLSSAAPPAQALAMPTNKGDLKAGQLYQTSRGPAKWNGTAFEQ